MRWAAETTAIKNEMKKFKKYIEREREGDEYKSLGSFDIEDSGLIGNLVGLNVTFFFISLRSTAAKFDTRTSFS